MKKLNLIMSSLILIASSCSKDQWNVPRTPDSGNASEFNIISPQIRIAVISDIHYLDQSLMPDDYVNNPYFQGTMAYDRKLIELSDPIFRQAIKEIISEKPDILLITGDLTKDGELASHEKVKEFLQKIENEGIKVYVIPGNNDINNTDAVTYKTLPPSPVTTTDPDGFESLYGNFGFNEAIYRDDNSLSYICKPCKGVWILGIDANYYSPDGVSGQIDPSTIEWIQENMAEAVEDNITVLAMMHYGIIDHYSVQSMLEPLVEDPENLAAALMNAGIKVIFTGHYHANDIVEFTYDGKTLTDVETGSLVTPLSPYRIMTLDDNFLNIDSRQITHIDAELPDGMDFLTYSDVTITNRLNSLFTYILRSPKFGMPKEDAILYAPMVTSAFKAYFAGDEKLDPTESGLIYELSQGPYASLAYILNSVWNDLPPKDNKTHIKLK